jgi:anti-sigma regulatory factor (Ser/Thr protein kinase)
MTWEHWRFGASDALHAESARRLLRDWLAQHTRGDCGEAELIYGELIGNVVRHSPGAIDVDVVCADDRIRLFVQSGGAPFQLRPELPESPLSECGRGIFIVDTMGSNLRAAELPVFGNQISVDLPLVRNAISVGPDAGPSGASATAMPATNTHSDRTRFWRSRKARFQCCRCRNPTA